MENVGLLFRFSTKGAKHKALTSPSDVHEIQEINLKSELKILG